MNIIDKLMCQREARDQGQFFPLIHTQRDNNKFIISAVLSDDKIVLEQIEDMKKLKADLESMLFDILL